MENVSKTMFCPHCFAPLTLHREMHMSHFDMAYRCTKNKKHRYPAACGFDTELQLIEFLKENLPEMLKPKNGLILADEYDVEDWMIC